MSVPFGGGPIPGIDSHGLPSLTPTNSQLCVLNGPGSGSFFALHNMNIVVGRNDPPSTTVDIDLTGCELGTPAMVSRRHAELQWVEGELKIVDLCSRNGTFVDGERLQSSPESPIVPHVLRFGSKVRFANLETEITVIND